MESNVTHGTLKLSMIFCATVVLPDALPPQTPAQDINFIVTLNFYHFYNWFITDKTYTSILLRSLYLNAILINV